MLNFIVYLFAFFITIPILATTIIYMVQLKLGRTKKRALHTSVNWTTLLYIIAVEILLTVIFERSFIGYILIVFLSILAFIIIFQWKKYTEISLRKALRIHWRLSFLIFLFLYFVLLFMGLILQWIH